jgi:(4S)-4-hydroxy-5-phosphonooxypentane-2,3-dione isomerase
MVIRLKVNQMLWSEPRAVHRYFKRFIQPVASQGFCRSPPADLPTLYGMIWIENYKGGNMHIALVTIHVKADFIQEFIEATQDNVRHSMQEAGVARFYLIQNQQEPTNFVLVEVFHDSEAPAKHKETAHYQRWRDRVAGMMATPRQSTTYTDLFPDITSLE